METIIENPHKATDEIVEDDFNEFKDQHVRHFQDAWNKNRLDETTAEEKSASDESSEPARPSFNPRSPLSSTFSVPCRAEERGRTLRYIGRGNNGNGLTTSMSYELFDSQKLSDDYSDFPDSERLSPGPFEQEPWSNPAPLRSSSGNYSPRAHSPDFGAIWSGTSPRGIQDYLGLSKPYEDNIYLNTYEPVARKPLQRWPSRWQPLTPTTLLENTNESFELVSRSSLDLDKTAWEHLLYHNVVPKADGLYHCPFEDDPKVNCMHKAEKLKCNYDKLVDVHWKSYRCKVSACRDLCFSSTARLLYHEREAHAMHGNGEKPFLCTYKGCERGSSGNGFPRHWNLRDHIKRVHNDTGHQPKSNTARSPPASLPAPRANKRKLGDNSWGIIATSSGTERSPYELSLAERYNEKQRMLLETVAKIQDLRNTDNMALLRDAHDCIKVMVQMAQRISPSPGV